MRIPVGLSLTFCALAVLSNCGREKDPAGPEVVEPRGRPFLSGGGSYSYVVIDSFTGVDGTNIVSHTANTGQSWSLSGGWTNKIKIQGNTAQLASGFDSNNWRMAITTDVADDTFDIFTDYTRGSQDVLGDYAQLEFLAKSGANPPTDRVYVSISRQTATTVMIRVIRTINFSTGQSIILDSAFPLSTGATKRIGATVTGLSLQVWWEPAGGGTRTNIGSPVTLTADYRDGLHKRVAFNFVGAQAFSAGSPRIDNFIVAKPAPPDTGWVLLVDRLPDLDTSLVVALPSDTFRVYRTDVGLSFNANVTDSAKRIFFTNHSMTSIQFTQTGRFFVRVPDPGSAAALLQLIGSLRNESQIARAGWIPRSALEEDVSYRFPVDGVGQKRVDWVPNTASTWAMRAIRSPLAWGCETGDYDNTPVRLGMVEYKHQETHPELAHSSPQLWAPTDDAQLTKISPPASQAAVEDKQKHAMATTGLLSAEGNNGSGIAGVNWRSDLRLYAAYSAGNRQLPFQTGLYVLTGKVQADAPRVLSFSIDQRVPHGPSVTQLDRETAIDDAASDLRQMLLLTPGLLIVVAAGNEQFHGTVANYRQDPNARLLRAALLTLREEPTYSVRIIVVAGTYTGNNFWAVSPYNSNEGSNFFTGATDVAAPAQDVTVLDRWTGGGAVPTTVRNGTSLSAPLVAGVAGLLLGMDPSLTPVQVKDFIVRGAQQPRANEQTGQVALPQPVSGAPATIYQLDAYGSLTLMAGERQQVPLCGNRVWVQNNQVIAERDPTTHTTETLINLNEARSFVNVRHGGRRFEVSNDFDDKPYEFQQDHWVETQNAATTPYGGTFVSMEAWSHDLDTLARDRYWTSADTAFFEHRVNTFNPSTERFLDTLRLTLTRFTDGECVRKESDGDCNLGMWSVGTEERVQEKFAYAPIGNRLFVTVSYFVTRWLFFSGWSNCPLPPPGPNGDPDQTTCRNTTYQEVSERTDLYAIDLTTGAQAFRWTIPGQVYWLGISEDGGQVVTGQGVLTTVWTWQPRLDGSGFEQVWSNPGTVTDCSIHYRTLDTNAEVRPQILTTDGCTTPTRGNGTIAPAPVVGPISP
jgi:hypothetical protein